MIGRPTSDEAMSYYFKYIDLVPSDDVAGTLEAQLGESLGFLQGISEEKSLHRYGPDKWSIREVINHVSDTERVFTYRALWFGRGFDSPLPSFDEKISSEAARADETSWAGHLEELRGVRLATLALFRHLPAEAWTRSGIASGNSVSVRALAFITAGHLAHHLGIVRERYL